MTNTVLGQETLELVNDGMLGASAGFLPGWDAEAGAFMEEWPTPSYRRLNKVWLHHIALTPEPAYEWAQVLAVREKGNGALVGVSTERSETPNLDLVRGWRLEDEVKRVGLG